MGLLWFLLGAWTVGSAGLLVGVLAAAASRAERAAEALSSSDPMGSAPRTP